MDTIKTKLKKLWKEISHPRLSIQDQTFFVKRLSFLIKAGVPIEESLTLIREQTTTKGYAAILDSVIIDVSNGQNLSTSLHKFKNTFGEFTINLIAFGEESGVLSENLEYIAEELKKKEMLRKKILSASLYPIIVTLATFGVIAFLLLYVFPKIIPIFKSMNMNIPLSTRIVMASSIFIQHYGLLTLLLIICVSITCMIIFKKKKQAHFYFDNFLFNIPVIRKIIINYNMANFTRTTGLLLKSGITMSEALPIVVKTTSNLVYKKQFETLGGVVNRGAKISAHLHDHRKLFPDIATHIIATGEQSGNLPHSLLYLSEMYETELDDFTKNLSSLVEPLLMIIMGIFVGFIAISIITPIYGITQHLQAK